MPVTVLFADIRFPQILEAVSYIYIYIYIYMTLIFDEIAYVFQLTPLVLRSPSIKSQILFIGMFPVKEHYVVQED